jgi:hypothetical protein
MDFDAGQAVTLTAQPAAGSRLASWDACTQLAADCSVTVDQEKTVTATFAPSSYRLVAAVTGKGKVASTPGGIACPGRCSGSFAFNSTVTLRAVAAKGYRFTGWAGACSGRGSCRVPIHANANVRATFAKA